MSKAVDNLMKAMDARPLSARRWEDSPIWPRACDGPELTRNLWSLPACQSLFLTDEGPVVMQGVAPGVRCCGRTTIRSGCPDCGVANRSGGRKHVSRVSRSQLARGSCSL